jgi:hypothetical protein
MISRAKVIAPRAASASGPAAPRSIIEAERSNRRDQGTGRHCLMSLDLAVPMDAKTASCSEDSRELEDRRHGGRWRPSVAQNIKSLASDNKTRM